MGEEPSDQMKKSTSSFQIKRSLTSKVKGHKRVKLVNNGMIFKWTHLKGITRTHFN